MSNIPFFIVKDFISPLACENIINHLRILRIRPNIGQNGNPKKMILANKLDSMRLAEIFDYYVPKVEEHFSFNYKGMHDIFFEWFPENSKAEPAQTDGYAKNKEGWTRNREVDFTGILWLNDYNDESPFDASYETFGGRLEFPNFDVSFNPERGTLILFPSSPNFVYSVSEVSCGSLTQAKFVVRSEKPYEYDPKNFDSNSENWNL